jgi:hypothetical protein
VIFGGGPRVWSRSARRLSKELLQLPLISGVEIYSPEDLRLRLPEFWALHSSFLTSNTRGFGYWIWKPYIVKEALENLLPQEDGVLYIDAGSSINWRSMRAIERFDEYVDFANTSGGLFFRLKGDNSHTKFTKRDVLESLGKEHLRDENLVAATVFLLATGSNSGKLLDEWIGLACEQNYRHLVDPKPEDRQSDGFVAHRHDQSILSIALENKNFTVIPDETYFAPNWVSNGRNYPLWATRIRSSLPFISDCLFMRVIRKIEGLIFK